MKICVMILPIGMVWSDSSKNSNFAVVYSPTVSYDTEKANDLNVPSSPLSSNHTFVENDDNDENDDNKKIKLKLHF